jgi:hypothetical protein
MNKSGLTHLKRENPNFKGFGATPQLRTKPSNSLQLVFGRFDCVSLTNNFGKELMRKNYARYKNYNRYDEF